MAGETYLDDDGKRLIDDDGKQYVCDDCPCADGFFLIDCRGIEDDKFVSDETTIFSHGGTESWASLSGKIVDLSSSAPASCWQVQPRNLADAIEDDEAVTVYSSETTCGECWGCVDGKRVGGCCFSRSARAIITRFNFAAGSDPTEDWYPAAVDWSSSSPSTFTTDQVAAAPPWGNTNNGTVVAWYKDFSHTYDGTSYVIRVEGNYTGSTDTWTINHNIYTSGLSFIARLGSGTLAGESKCCGTSAIPHTQYNLDDVDITPSGPGVIEIIENGCCALGGICDEATIDCPDGDCKGTPA